MARPSKSDYILQAPFSLSYLICLGPASAYKSTLTMQNMLNIQLDTGQSNTGMRQLASTLNKATETLLVKPFFQQKFCSSWKIIDRFLSTLIFPNFNGEKKSSRTKTYCSL